MRSCSLLYIKIPEDFDTTFAGDTVVGKVDCSSVLKEKIEIGISRSTPPHSLRVLYSVQSSSTPTVVLLERYHVVLHAATTAVAVAVAVAAAVAAAVVLVLVVHVVRGSDLVGAPLGLT